MKSIGYWYGWWIIVLFVTCMIATNVVVDRGLLVIVDQTILFDRISSPIFPIDCNICLLVSDQTAFIAPNGFSVPSFPFSCFQTHTLPIANIKQLTHPIKDNMCYFPHLYIYISLWYSSTKEMKNYKRSQGTSLVTRTHGCHLLENWDSNQNLHINPNNKATCKLPTTKMNYFWQIIGRIAKWFMALVS